MLNITYSNDAATQQSPDHAQGRPARVVVVSSSAHGIGSIDLQDLHYRHRKYSSWGAYGESLPRNVAAPSTLAASTYLSIYHMPYYCGEACATNVARMACSLARTTQCVNLTMLFRAWHTRLSCGDCCCCCRAIKACQHPVCKAACKESRGYQCESLLIASRQALFHSIRHFDHALLSPW